MKKIISVLCTAALLCGLLVAPAVTASEASLQTVVPQKSLLNVTLAKPIYTSSMLDSVNTNQIYAVDESDATYWAPTAEDSAPYIVVDLTQPYTFKRLDVSVSPKKNFIVSASKNGTEWVQIHSQGDIEYEALISTNSVLRIDLDRAETYRYVKIHRPEGYTGADFQVADICVYAPYYTNQRNVAVGRASEGAVEGGKTDQNWYHVNNLTDEVVENNFAYAQVHETKKSYFTIDLGKAYNINYIEVYNGHNNNGIVGTNIHYSRDFEVYGANVGGDAEMLQTDPSAEYVGGYDYLNAAGEQIGFGPQWSTIRFDTNFTEPKRYIQIASKNINQEIAFGDIHVYTDQEDIVTVTPLEDVMTGKSGSTAGPEDFSHYFGYLQDRNEETVWTSDVENGRNFYGVDLAGVYNIRKIELVTGSDAACANFEIWGGDVNGGLTYDGSYKMQMLASQGSEPAASERIVLDVEVFNQTRYLTLKSHTSGQTFKEIYVWVESDGQYQDVSTGKKASHAAMTNGNSSIYDTAVYCEQFQAEYPDLVGSDVIYPEGDCYTPADCLYMLKKYEMCNQFIDLGKPMRVDFLRLYARTDMYRSAENCGFTVWGSNSLTEGWVRLTTVQANRAMIHRYSDVAINSTEKYRYIGIAKSYNDLKRSIAGGTPLNAGFFLNYSEVTVFAKERQEPMVNITPLARVIKPTEDENVAKIFDGDTSTTYTSDISTGDAIIDLGKVYTLADVESVGGGEALELYSYTENIDYAEPLVAGVSCRYVVISGAADLAELRLLVSSETVSQLATAECKFVDANGNEIVDFAQVEWMGAELKLCNLTNGMINANVFVALYDTQENLVDIDLVSGTLAAYTSQLIKPGFDAPAGITAGYSLKCFVWGDGNQPITGAFSLDQ